MRGGKVAIESVVVVVVVVDDDDDDDDLSRWGVVVVL